MDPPAVFENSIHLERFLFLSTTQMLPQESQWLTVLATGKDTNLHVTCRSESWSPFMTFFLFCSLCLISSVSHSHQLWGTAVFLSQTRIPVLLAYFRFPTEAFSFLYFLLFSYPSYIFYLVFSTTTGQVDRTFSLTAVSPESLLCPTYTSSKQEKRRAGLWIGP